MFPATENTRSDGALIAGINKYFCASLVSFGYISFVGPPLINVGLFYVKVTQFEESGEFIVNATNVF
jgi:hypothetical protein